MSFCAAFSYPFYSLSWDRKVLHYRNNESIIGYIICSQETSKQWCSVPQIFIVLS